MEFAGFVAEDAPDPAAEIRRRVTALGIPVAGFVAQAHLEDAGLLGLTVSRAGRKVDRAEVSRSYTLWRNPANRSDPANLAALADEVRASLDAEPLVPLPAWLHERRRRMRMPMIWEAVRTHWVPQGGAETLDLRSSLIGHAEYVLHNTFREELRVPWPDWRKLVPDAAAQPHPVLVDGLPRDGLLVDTDPFVLAIGAVLAPDRALTAVVPRDELLLITLEFLSDASSFVS